MLAQQARGFSFDFSVVTNNLDLYWAGVRLTLFIAVTSFVLATLLGVLIALMRLSRNRLVGAVAAAYINLFRAIPLLVFILFVYYGVRIAFGLTFFTALRAGIFAFTVQYSAWLGEIFRAGIQAVPGGQREAALSVGMGRARTFFTIVMPQAVRISIPPTGNMLIGMVKDSSLVYILGVNELLRTTNLLANRTFRYFETYLATVGIYLVLTTAIYYLVKYLERRFAISDVLSQATRRYSPFARNRYQRLRTLQEAVGGGSSIAP